MSGGLRANECVANSKDMLLSLAVRSVLRCKCNAGGPANALCTAVASLVSFLRGARLQILSNGNGKFFRCLVAGMKNECTGKRGVVCQLHLREVFCRTKGNFNERGTGIVGGLGRLTKGGDVRVSEVLLMVLYGRSRDGPRSREISSVITLLPRTLGGRFGGDHCGIVLHVFRTLGHLMRTKRFDQ